MTVSDIIQMLSAQLLVGDINTSITGYATLTDAKSGDVSFFADPRYKQALAETKASVILVPPDWDSFPEGTTCLAVERPSEAFSLVAARLASASHGGGVIAGAEEQPAFQAQIHPRAVIGEHVIMNPDRVRIGANAVIEDGAQIGDEVEIGPGCYIGRNVQIGAQTRLYTNVTVNESCVLGQRVILHAGVVIGADGFGYRFEKGRHVKVPQTGIVQIDNDVEIGANTTIDRARIGKTWIGEGTKIDNLVQIAHNVTIGKHCVIVAQSGIAGSSSMGDYVVLAGQAGVTGHVTIGSFCTIGARSVVSKNLPDGKVSYLGFPAVPAMQERRRMVAAKQVPEVLERVKNLEQKLIKTTD